MTYMTLSSASHWLAGSLSRSTWHEESRYSIHENKYYYGCMGENGLRLALKIWLSLHCGELVYYMYYSITAAIMLCNKQPPPNISSLQTASISFLTQVSQLRLGLFWLISAWPAWIQFRLAPGCRPILLHISHLETVAICTEHTFLGMHFSWQEPKPERGI